MRSKLVIGLLLILYLIPLRDVYAQANKTNSGDVSCPANGSSIEVLAARSGRFSFVLNNVSGIAVRIGYPATGTAALNNTTAWLLQPGQGYAESAPGLISNRIVCMSTTPVIAIISFNETYR